MVGCCPRPSVQSRSSPHSSDTLPQREPMVPGGGWRVEFGDVLQFDASRVDVLSAGAAELKTKLV